MFHMMSGMILSERVAFTLLDVRNDYEIAAGSFKNATTTNIKSFAEVYEWIDDNISHLDKNIIISIYCVHGVRSKIAGKYIKSLGFMNVFHLQRWYCRIYEIHRRYEAQCLARSGLCVVLYLFS